MGNKLLVIESPNKIKTLSKYLDKDFDIIATVGHIRDLSKYGLGFSLDTFEPKWTVMDEQKKELIDEINNKAHNASEIYIATDPDREGEAIAWHVYEVLDNEDKKKCKRITFNEITKTAVLESFENKREINIEWVHSQFARRIIDRLIGFKLSQLMQSKLKAESAGRVQSVALKFISEREDEIKAFKPTYWWTIDSVLLKKVNLHLKQLSSKFKLEEQENVSGTGFKFKSVADAKKVFDTLDDKFLLTNISEPVKMKSSPKKPYKTSTLQQDSINKLNFSTKQTTSIAQRLYEGVDIDGIHIALISYPRTDSTRMSDVFIKNASDFIVETYGKEYLGNYKNEKQAENAQDAHEAIRPVDVTITPDSLKGKLPKNELALYKLIWNRTVSTLMSDSIFEKVTYTFTNNDNIFEAGSKVCVFDGYQKVFKDDSEQEEIIDKDIFKINQEYQSTSMEVKNHETAPPPRFTQASLIQALEKAGVGRPSTYNTMVNLVLDRNYATLESKAYHVTDIGGKVINELNNFFPTEINKDFTKQMEERLDHIAAGEEEWTTWLKTFTPEFLDKVNVAKEKMEKVEDEKVGELCPECGHDLVYKVSKKYRSKFIGCSNYPHCKYIRSLKAKEEPKELNIPCPLCSKNIVIRKNKKGTEFIACTGFPKCHYMLDMRLFKKHEEEAPGTPLPVIEKAKKK